MKRSERWEADGIMALQTIEDIIRALQEHPEWREPLLQVLLPERYQQLPERTDRLEQALARLAEESAKTDQKLRELGEYLQRSKEENDRAFQELRESLQRSKEENDRAFQELRESLQRSKEENDRAFQELRESLQRSKEENERAHQEMREYFRRVQEEHDRMIQQMREEQQETERRRRELEERTEKRFQELMAEMRAFSRRLDRVEHDVADLKGYHLESYYRDNAAAILGRYFRALRVIDKGEYFQRIHEQAPPSEEEWKQLVSTDLLLRGRHWGTGTEYLMVWEISWRIDRNDVLRAVQRAELLRRWEDNTLPVVAGKSITTGAQQLAQQNGVFVVLETSVINGTSLAPRG